MIWLTWRQFRLQALVIGAAALAIGFALILTGPDLLNTYQTYKSGFLDQLEFQQWNKRLYIIGTIAMYAAPPLIGAFWGAPMVARELEAGTHRLVWNQSISRTRWLLTKLAISGGSALVVTGLLSLAVSRWADPIDDAVGAGQQTNSFLPRLWPAVFGARGVVPIGYTAFAFALGVAIGIVVRRSLVAVAITLAVVIAVQIFTPTLLRPHLVTPATTTVIVTTENMRGIEIQGSPTDPQVKGLEVQMGGPGDWKLSDRTVNSAGKPQAFLPTWFGACAPPPPNAPEEKEPRQSLQTCFTRLADEGYRQQIKYIPANRFWDLQWRETGVFFALAFLLVGFSVWRIRRDLT
ncbi:ABC transporter permease subunit [Kribbella qitaiheensis]|uniref:ABC transporter permease subunit n=1 Tax=Kribbella qitaiheensis TaxID=1544730 RepID=A0A7G6WXT7_9ACTN|nr:ABC transporter permease subunit [Kribbella qitaiheensis]QNE18802.1 ABC transporter permease subunit [Kribbella qitaiheensis]